MDVAKEGGFIMWWEVHGKVGKGCIEGMRGDYVVQVVINVHRGVDNGRYWVQCGVTGDGPAVVGYVLYPLNSAEKYGELSTDPIRIER